VYVGKKLDVHPARLAFVMTLTDGGNPKEEKPFLTGIHYFHYNLLYPNPSPLNPSAKDTFLLYTPDHLGTDKSITHILLTLNLQPLSLSFLPP
jgi:hypothetical protein